MNILELLGVEQREDSITNLLAAGIRHSADFKLFFIRAVAPDLADRYTDWTVRTRVATSHGIPDLVLGASGDVGDALIVVENKVKAEEGFEQTKRYSEPQCAAELASTLGLENVIEKRLIFLTLFPEEPCTTSGFVGMTHRFLLDYPANPQNDVERLIYDWQSLLTSFYAAGDIDLAAPLMQRLAEEKLEAGFLYFKSFIHEIAERTQLDYQGASRSSMPGRRIYFGHLGGQGWSQGEWIKAGDKWKFDDPSKHHAIFLQFQYSVLDGSLILRLKYETNGYEPQNWVRNNVVPEHLSEYLSRRKSFVSELTNELPPEWNIWEGWNQIAKTEIDVCGASTETGIAVFSERCKQMAVRVDEILTQPY